MQTVALSQNRVPAPHDPVACGVVAKPGSLAVDEFKRKGGQSRNAKVSFQDGELTTVSVAEGRDLRQYDRLRLIDSAHRTVPEQEKNSILGRARTFLFEHWRDHKQAYLTLTLSSVDATSTAHIFLERDAAGRWRVSWRFVRDFGRVDDLPTYYSVEWVMPYGRPETPLPQGATADPLTDRLAFRGKCGGIDHSF